MNSRYFHLSLHVSWTEMSSFLKSLQKIMHMLLDFMTMIILLALHWLI